MCLIAHREINGKRGSNIPNDVIDYNLLHNPDGFGIAWREPGKGVVWEKFGPTLTDAASFRAKLKEIDGRTTVEYVAHWRMATHGDKCLAMSHPFPYEDREGNEMLAFHNGIIDIHTQKGESDTAAYVREILAGLPPRWWLDQGIVDCVEWSIGWSRLALMSATETVRIGEWDGKKDGIWYSAPPRGFALRSSGKGSEDWTNYRDDGDEEDAVIKAYSGVTGKRSWYDRVQDDPETDFHKVLLAENRELDLDDMADVWCSDCYSVGQVYSIDGTSWVDVNHRQTSEVTRALVAVGA